MLRNKTIFALFLWLTCTATAQAIDPQQQVAPIDTIVAVVNDDVITSHELNERIGVVVKQLKRQGTPLPAMDVLKKQLLERMIMDMLQEQYAKETGVRVDDAAVDKSLLRIAQRNNFPSVDAFRAKLEEQGVDFKKFRQEIRDQILSTRLREREVDTKLVITDSEIDNYLATEAKQTSMNQEYHLAHIYVTVPEQASAAKIQASQRKANEALDKLNAGADFAQVAAGYSDASDALRGGDLGWHPAGQIPLGFRAVLDRMKPGEVSPLLRTPNGFHIIKLIGLRTHEAPVVITQTHARHILIKTSDLVSDQEARDRLLEIRKQIEAGASFAEEAKRYSQDGSASQGGDLGWLSPGETIPEFEKAMDALRPGEISYPVQTGFGWHLIEVLARRTADVTEAQKRQRARLAIQSFKSDERWQDWLRQLRDRAYVQYRLGDQND